MNQKIKEILSKKKADLMAEKLLPLPVVTSFTSTFFDSLHAANPGIIAEIKLASPTSPSLGDVKGLAARVKAYEKGGANAISVITERYFFKGELSLITQVKSYSKIPVFQKDFVIDAFQIQQAQSLGSDAILLIARIVTQKKLQKFVELAIELGVEPVVEVFSMEDLKKALNTKTRIIAVNARDLDSFTMDVKRARDILAMIPSSYLRLGFSGIETKEDIAAYTKAGAHGVLIGTTLMKSVDPESTLKELRG